MSDYVKPSLKKELMDKIQKFIEEYPEHGYRSLAQFVEDAVRRRADELRVFDLTPRFRHVNTGENHVTIEDKKLGRIFDVFIRPIGQSDFELWCSHCDNTHCEHVKFAITIPGMMKPLKTKGWNYRE